MNGTPEGEQVAAQMEEVRRLRIEHRDLDDAIAALTRVGMPDQLQIG